VRVRWTRRALRGLDSIAEFIARDRPEAARKTVERVWDRVSELARFPDLGRPGRIPGTRELVVSGTPLIVPYRVRLDQVEVVAVFHGAQRWPEKL
jgi:addiction module RelE/StbE family toxin